MPFYQWVISDFSSMFHPTFVSSFDYFIYWFLKILSMILQYLWFERWVDDSFDIGLLWLLISKIWLRFNFLTIWVSIVNTLRYHLTPSRFGTQWWETGYDTCTRVVYDYDYKLRYSISMCIVLLIDLIQYGWLLITWLIYFYSQCNTNSWVHHSGIQRRTSWLILWFNDYDIWFLKPYDVYNLSDFSVDCALHGIFYVLLRMYVFLMSIFQNTPPPILQVTNLKIFCCKHFLL